ncbi:MAG: AAA family ATPase, partial [Bacteroidia bacterium]|nr:AAA family ATPase [Bacteroidia bacterium]
MSRIRVFFPYGVSNFEILVKDGYVFVDKTQFIEKLEQNKERNVAFLRPRKFGKSLWLSILEYYYDINQQHKFEVLFGKYYIGKNPTPLHNTYRILRFDFSGIDSSTK